MDEAKMEKAKNDYKPGRSLLKRMMILVGIGILALFGLALAASFAMMFVLEQTRSGEFVDELPLDLVPTAEYLLSHPLPMPEGYSLYDNSPDGRNYSICIVLNFSVVIDSSRVFMNGTRLPIRFIDNNFLLPDERGPDGKARSETCFSVGLEKGLYLFGFQPSVVRFYPIHQWAIEIK